MDIGNVKEYKIKINEIEYTFRLDFKALIKFNNKFTNSMKIFNEYLQGINEYDCIVKILSCSCKEKDWSEEELLNSISFDFPTMTLLDQISLNMIKGSIVLDEAKIEDKEKNEKN